MLGEADRNYQYPYQTFAKKNNDQIDIGEDKKMITDLNYNLFFQQQNKIQLNLYECTGLLRTCNKAAP